MLKLDQMPAGQLAGQTGSILLFTQILTTDILHLKPFLFSAQSQGRLLLFGLYHCNWLVVSLVEFSHLIGSQHH